MGSSTKNNDDCNQPRFLLQHARTSTLQRGRQVMQVLLPTSCAAPSQEQLCRCRHQELTTQHNNSNMNNNFERLPFSFTSGLVLSVRPWWSAVTVPYWRHKHVSQLLSLMEDYHDRNNEAGGLDPAYSVSTCHDRLPNCCPCCAISFHF